MLVRARRRIPVQRRPAASIPLGSFVPGARALQENCTLTQGFWKNHEDAWPVEELTLGDVTYTQAELLVVLSTPPRGGDATYILAHQLIAAKLNVAHGADASAIETTLAEADAWLAENPLGSKPRGDAREAGLELAAALDDYNNGVTGPGHCDSTPLPSPTPTPEPGRLAPLGPVRVSTRPAGRIPPAGSTPAPAV